MNSELLPTLRPVTWSDRDFLWELKKRTLKPYIEIAWGWDDLIAMAFLVRGMPHANIVMVDGEQVGVLKVIDREADVHLAEIGLDPSVQNRGLGTRLIGDVMARAAERRVPATLQVMTANPAQRLYRRLGFEVYEEDRTHMQMRWRSE